MRCHVRLDERGAAFFAIGCTLASGQPTVVLTTSGTASAELHAGVVEAHHAGVALIVCTADRPPALHGVGAPQTIDQRGLFASAVGWSVEPGVAEATGARWWRSIAARSVVEARFGRGGPGPRERRSLARRPRFEPRAVGRGGGRVVAAVERSARPARGGGRRRIT